MMYLKKILQKIRYSTRDDISRVAIRSVTADSRHVKKGDLFVAIKGFKLDGHRFITEAVSRGADVIITEKDVALPPRVKKITVEDARTILPLIACNFYNNPSQNMTMIGVTGTNGKTTITYLIENILKAAGKEAGVIGTINYRFKAKEFPSKNTTPGALELQAILAEMVKGKVLYCVMEVSSHALDQHRVDGIQFDSAIFTNLTSEHLDYHKTVEGYFAAKKAIFDKLKGDGVAILNSDDRRVARLEGSLKGKALTYGIENAARVRAEDIELSADGSRFVAVLPDGAINIQTRLVGRHNVSNILASIAAAYEEGIDFWAIKRGVESLRGVPGRLEPIEMGQPFKVFVDYAHTGDALYNVLGLLREVVRTGRIITVFGCGGNRDRKKRPLMGRVACGFSDKVIITSDNPRDEKPRLILKEIESGVKEKFSNYVIIEDRRAAIERALSAASEGDVVVIAGKGHEGYQIVKDEVIPFDDAKAVRSFLRRKGYAR